MDEEFDSLIVTDPDLVDPGIDVSGLRTQTDTSLLGNIPDFAGIQYEAFNPNRLSDLMRLYSTGLPMIDTAQVPGAIDTLVAGGGGSGDGGQVTVTPEQQEGFLQNVLGQAGQTVEGALTQLGKIPGAIVDIANQTVDIFGKKLNVGKTLASLAVNKLVGAPVSLVFDVAKEFLPERDPRQNALDEFYDIKNGTIQSGIMKGYNPVSGGFPGISEPNYGLQETYDKRIDNTRNTLQEKYGLTNEELDSIEAGNITDAIKQKAISDEMSKAYGKPTTSNLVANLAELSDLKAREKNVIDAATTGAPQEDIGAISGDTGADPITGDLPGGGNIYDEFAPSDDKDDSPAPSTPSVNEADVEAGLGQNLYLIL
jgi:hypothetical protein